MRPTGELLIRNRARLEAADETLWFNPPADAPWRDLQLQPGRLLLFTQDYGNWRRLGRDGANAHFGDFPDPDTTRPDTVILELPREKARLCMLAHCIAGMLNHQGTLWVAGENRAGVRSSPRHLATWFEQVEKTDSARHCVLVRATGARHDAPFEADRYREEWTLEQGKHRLTVCSWPGVFAHGGLDEGTELLLGHLPRVGPGHRVLDFGCGAGMIGAALASGEPAIELVMADSSALACRASAATLAANGLSGQVIPSDGFSDLAGKFDLIISNPPFHSGHEATSGLTPSLLGSVRNFLNPGGQLMLVANRHLPYRRWLDGLFGRHDVVAATGRFHLLRVVERTG